MFSGFLFFTTCVPPIWVCYAAGRTQYMGGNRMGAPRKIQYADQVRDSMAVARQYAETHGVPVTMERLAVCLGIGLREFSGYIERGENSDDAEEREIAQALKSARAECQAAMMEHGLGRGNNPVMPIFALKANYGYNDKPEGETSRLLVQFVDDVPE